MGVSEVTKIYKSGIDAENVKGQPPIKWEDKGLEYMRKKGCKNERA